MTVELLFQSLWQDYIRRLCPSAQQVHHLLQHGEPLINDHIALRTFDIAPVGLDALAKPFIDLGYFPCGDYHFASKKLNAKHFEHSDPLHPKVFISELIVDQCSNELQQRVAQLVDQVAHDDLIGSDFLHSGRIWDVSYEQYLSLAQESEYAAWVAAHGYGANHFTVNINQLHGFNQVIEVNNQLEAAGFVINRAGGEVKGTPEVMLEQSSTMADLVEVQFKDGLFIIPGGFYEFAKRYPMANGELYSGFVEASADKIFESTHRS
jgi:hypothetical protein